MYYSCFHTRLNGISDMIERSSIFIIQKGFPACISAAVGKEFRDKIPFTKEVTICLGLHQPFGTEKERGKKRKMRPPDALACI